MGRSVESRRMKPFQEESDITPTEFRGEKFLVLDRDDQDVDDYLLSEDGQARRRFLKQALLVGSGVAAANLLLEYQQLAEAAPMGAANLSGSTTLPSVLSIRLRVNGRDYPLQIDSQTTLLDALRERIGLTGSKKGCDRGQCGACTVLANGRRINSCLALAAAYAGAEITTIEGLANEIGRASCRERV